MRPEGKRLEKLLSGGDLRSLRNCNRVVASVHGKKEFDTLFKLLFHNDRLVVMRSADAVEKITIAHPEYLKGHEEELVNLFYASKNIELMWHIAQMMPRLKLTKKVFAEMRAELEKRALDKKNSKLVRVAAVQALYEMTKKEASLLAGLQALMKSIEPENIASVNARIRNIRKELDRQAPGK